MGEVVVEGGDELRALALQLTAAGQVELLAAMRRNVRVAVAPAKDAIKSSALATLPHEGGLNEWVASSSFVTNTLIGPRTAGVRLRVSRKGAGRNHDLVDLDAGAIRHPVYGNRQVWVSQNITPGFASKPVEALTPGIVAACLIAMNETSAAAGFI